MEKKQEHSISTSSIEENLFITESPSKKNQNLYNVLKSIDGNKKVNSLPLLLFLNRIW